MFIESPRFGRIEVDEESVVTFPNGLLGFREFKQYVFHGTSPDAILIWMQCVEVPALAFVVVDPRLVKPDYEVKVTPSQLEPIGLTDPAKAQVYVTLTIPQDPTQVTANLQGPIVVNLENRLAAQVVLNDDSATTKYPVLDALRQGTVGAGQG